MSQTLTLPDEVTIYEATALHQTLSAALLSPDGATADLSHIAEIDTAGIQVLIWAEREATRLGRPLALTRPSPVLIDALALLGLTGALHFMEDAA